MRMLNELDFIGDQQVLLGVAIEISDCDRTFSRLCHYGRLGSSVPLPNHIATPEFMSPAEVGRKVAAYVTVNPNQRGWASRVLV